MQLVFVGTRGGIGKRSRRHRRHAALIVGEKGGRVLIDCGADWLGRFEALRPDAIMLTHAHPDHASGLSAGASCPVYAAVATWARLGAYPIARREVLPLRQPTQVGAVACGRVPPTFRPPPSAFPRARRAHAPLAWSGLPGAKPCMSMSSWRNRGGIEARSDVVRMSCMPPSRNGRIARKPARRLDQAVAPQPPGLPSARRRPRHLCPPPIPSAHLQRDPLGDVSGRPGMGFPRLILKVTFGTAGRKKSAFDFATQCV